MLIKILQLNSVNENFTFIEFYKVQSKSELSNLKFIFTFFISKYWDKFFIKFLFISLNLSYKEKHKSTIFSKSVVRILINFCSKLASKDTDKPY